MTLATPLTASGIHRSVPSVFTDGANNVDAGFVPLCQSRRVCCLCFGHTKSSSTSAGDATADVIERLPDCTEIEALEGYSLGWPSGAAGGVAGA